MLLQQTACCTSKLHVQNASVIDPLHPVDVCIDLSPSQYTYWSAIKHLNCGIAPQDISARQMPKHGQNAKETNIATFCICRDRQVIESARNVYLAVCCCCRRHSSSRFFIAPLGDFYRRSCLATEIGFPLKQRNSSTKES
jgi:hypothetical protein